VFFTTKALYFYNSLAFYSLLNIMTSNTNHPTSNAGRVLAKPRFEQVDHDLNGRFHMYLLGGKLELNLGNGGSRVEALRAGA